jgi:hypothetical protein
MRSSNIVIGQALANIPAGQSALFWTELANLSEDLKAVERFEARFGKFLPWAGLPTTIVSVNAENATFSSDIGFGAESSTEQRINVGYDPLLALRNEARAIWREDDLETKEWRVYWLRGDPTMSASFLATLDPHMRPTFFDKAVLHLLKSASRLRCCRNPECAAPYFFARRRSQKYCSEDCTLPFQRDYKRRWWHKSGNQWRKSRARKATHKTRHPTRATGS